jgi:hypothetical protein
MFSLKIISGVFWLALVFILAAQPTTVRAAQAGPVAVQTRLCSSAPANAPVFGYLQTWLGNRSRMIQVALVAVALGIFILHRK